MRRFTYILICLILLGLPIGARHVYAAVNKINAIDLTCQIDEQGTALIHETWDLSASSGTEAYKDINNMTDQPVTLIDVMEGDHHYAYKENWDIKASFEEKAERYGMIVDGDDYEICFGLTQYGRHRYTIIYQIEHFVNQYADAQGINYAFLSNMSLTVDQVTIDLSSKIEDFVDETCDIWGYGYHGTCVFENGHVMMRTSKELNGEKMQLMMRLGSTYGAPSQLHRDENMSKLIKSAKRHARFGNTLDTIMQTVMIILAIITTIALPVILVLSIIYGHLESKYEKRLYYEDGTWFKKNNVRMFRDLPEHTDILCSYEMLRKAHLINEADRANIINAFILKWLIDEIVTITPVQKNGLLGGTAYQIDLRKELPANASRIEQSTYEMLRKAAGKNHILEYQEFKKYYKNHSAALERWFRSVVYRLGSDELDEKYIYEKRARSHNRIFNVDYRQTVLTRQGQTLLNQLYGLKLFLLNEDNMKEKRAIEVHLWDEYLIYAALFNIADVVRKQIDIVCPEYQELSAAEFACYTILRDAIFDGDYTARRDYNNYSSGSSASSGGGGSSSYSGGGSSYSGGGGGGVR